MSVYKEGYYAIGLIQKNTRRIYPDACDAGAPTKKNDIFWNFTKQAAEWYGDIKTRKENRYLTGRSVSCIVTLLNEDKFSTGKYTDDEVIDKYKLTFVSCTTGACKGYDGYIYVEKII